MSFFPAGFDPRADVVEILNLCNINTPDGDFGFMLRSDGRYVDANGKVWWGSALFASPEVPSPINGHAPQGEIGMVFHQDPDLPDLAGQIRDLGAAYVRGRAITFYVVPMTDRAQFYAPTLAPIPLTSFEMRSTSIEAFGGQKRALNLSYEGVFAGRNEARGWFYNTADHAKMLGRANPSLSLMPSVYRDDEKLF